MDWNKEIGPKVEVDWNKKVGFKDFLNLFKRTKRPLGRGYRYNLNLLFYKKIKRIVGYEMIHIRIINGVRDLFVNLFESYLKREMIRDDTAYTPRQRTTRISPISWSSDPNDEHWEPLPDYWDTRQDYSNMSQRRVDRKIREMLDHPITNEEFERVEKELFEALNKKGYSL